MRVRTRWVDEENDHEFTACDLVDHASPLATLLPVIMQSPLIMQSVSIK
ncbi:MAG TPA: hypothetical protein VMT69_17715 [Kineosporiaceae bacterium]|nr:hypothetical protein [Kineosporiaceae bacterium]